jgi:hypothetical protein
MYKGHNYLWLRKLFVPAIIFISFFERPFYEVRPFAIFSICFILRKEKFLEFFSKWILLGDMGSLNFISRVAREEMRGVEATLKGH